MERGQSDQESERVAKVFKSKWADPKDLVHGFYLARANSQINAPIRLSTVAFTIEYDDQETLLMVDDEHAIEPLMVFSKPDSIKSNTLTLPFKTTVQNKEIFEATCIKVEHLLHPELYKLLVIARTFDAHRCTVESFIDSEQNDAPHLVRSFTQYLDMPKKITRIFLDIRDEKLNRLKFATDTFTCN